MRHVANAVYKDGYADVFDERGILLTRMRCDELVGYGPDGFVVRRANSYWAHKANGMTAMSPMTPYDFNKKKWAMHDTFLQIIC